MLHRMIEQVRVALVVALLLSAVEVGAVTLVDDGKPAGIIVIAEKPTIAANLAALELQYHIEEMTGAVLPIQSDGQTEETCSVRILVGKSDATRKLGLKSKDFKSQEYLIQVEGKTVVLMGRDWLDTPANRAEVGLGISDSLDQTRKKINYSVAIGRDSAKKQITLELPGLMDEQGTCYAVYDFLERFCDVRWYGPAPMNIVIPSQKTLTVPTVTIRRTPSLLHRYAPGGGWPILRKQWGRHHDVQKHLFLRRIRYGGEKWGCNHSFSSFRDRFLVKNPNKPELFECSEPNFFAVGYENEGHWRHLCLTNPKVVEQVVKDARNYFDGKGITGHQFAIGDYFSIVPADSDHWCKCDTCQAILEKSKSRKSGYFGSGAASDYVFGFVNAVAKEVKKTHPDKYIAALAYASYSYLPTFELESNVAVAPCMLINDAYTGSFKNDKKFYNLWIEESKRSGRPLHLWNYFHWPMEQAIIRGFKCFPNFMPDVISDWVKRYHRDGIRGFYLCGAPQQLDYCLYMQTAFNDRTELMTFTDEFFTGYFGAAAEPMKKFYWLISDTNRRQRTMGSSEKASWDKLGTKECMAELGALMDKAVKLASTNMEKQRVESWRKGVWEYMAEGRKEYIRKKCAREEKEFAIGVYGTGVDDERRLLAGGALDSHWQLVKGADAKWKGPEVYTVRLDDAPIPPWIEQGDDPKSKWITPNADGLNVSGGRYVYEQKFEIDDRMDLETASIFGRIVGDDVMERVEINGVKINAAVTNCDRWIDLLIMDHLVLGENTLRVVVKNGGESANPHGIRVEWVGWVDGK